MNNQQLINGPAEVIEHTKGMARSKYAYSTPKLMILATLAGIYISMGALLSVLVSLGIPGLTAANPGLTKLLAGITFPVGLLLIVLVGGDLFTGNNATLMPATLSGAIPRFYFLKNWAIVYVMNFVGAFAFVYLLVYTTHLVDAEPWRSGIISLAEGKCSHSFGVTFLKGIGANWLVCLALWLGFSAGTSMGRMLGIWWPVMTFVVMGYEHCIANMFYIPLAILEGADISWASFISNNLIPATLGNIVGGAGFVGCVYWYLYDQHKKKAVNKD